MAGGNNQPGGYDSRNPEYAGQYANVPGYGAANSAYAAPDISEDAPYNDEFGWSVHTRISTDNTPDAQREKMYPVREHRPDGSGPPEDYYAPLYDDERLRHQVEDQHGVGWAEQKSSYRIGPDPRWNPPHETRMTEQMSPASYSFTRPFDQHSKGNGARHLNGLHFSMADHRRDFPILGMKPLPQARNTYRIDPAPWDADMYDVPPQPTIGVTTQARIQAVDVPETLGTRSYRL